MTHADLVKRADKWLKFNQRCNVIFLEWYGGRQREIPDAIGFKKNSKSVLVECKASYSDFKADEEKYFRKRMAYGMGDFRYYMAPPGIIPIEELPKGWGLLEVYDKKVSTKVKSKVFDKGISSLKNENKLMINALRAVVCSTGKQLEDFRLCNDPVAQERIKLARKERREKRKARKLARSFK